MFSELNGCKISLKLQHLVFSKNFTADVVHERKAVQGKDNWYNLCWKLK